MDIPKYRIFKEHVEPYIKKVNGYNCVTIIVDMISELPKEERDQTTICLNALRLRKLADYLDSIQEVSPDSSNRLKPVVSSGQRL